MKGKSRKTTFAHREDGYGGNHPRGSFEVHPGMEKKLFDSFFRKAALKLEVEQGVNLFNQSGTAEIFRLWTKGFLIFLEGGL